MRGGAGPGAARVMIAAGGRGHEPGTVGQERIAGRAAAALGHLRRQRHPDRPPGPCPGRAGPGRRAGRQGGLPRLPGSGAFRLGVARGRGGPRRRSGDRILLPRRGEAADRRSGPDPDPGSAESPALLRAPRRLCQGAQRVADPADGGRQGGPGAGGSGVRGARLLRQARLRVHRVGDPGHQCPLSPHASVVACGSSRHARAAQPAGRDAHHRGG